MTVIIRSTRNGSGPTTLEGSSRDDLRIGDVITLTSVNTHLTYLWSILYKPSDKNGVASAASLTAPTNATTAFTVDKEGAYLISLLVDASLGTEDSSTLRLRAATEFGDLLLVGAGEKREDTLIPDDIDLEGWATTQNTNLLVMLDYISKVSSSGRVLYVDANRGTDYTESPDDPDVAEGFGHYSSISGAIAAALAASQAPSAAYPYLIRIRPGLYEDDFELPSYVNLLADSGIAGLNEDRSVVIRPENNSNPPISFSGSDSNSITFCKGITFENTASISNYPLFYGSGPGHLILHECSFYQKADNINQGPALHLEDIAFTLNKCVVYHEGTQADQVAAFVDNNVTSTIKDCSITGPIALDLNSSFDNSFAMNIRNSNLVGSISGNTESVVKLHAGSLTLTDVMIDSDSLSSGAYSFEVNPTDASSAVDYFVDIRFCLELGTLNFKNTNLSGNKSLTISSSNYTSLNSSGSFSSNYPQALTLASTIRFDDSNNNYIVADNVQDGIVALDSALLSAWTVAGTALEGIAEGLCVSQSGLGFVLANPLTSSGNTKVLGVNLNTVLASATALVQLSRTSTLLEFVAAPSIVNIGQEVYLSTTPGKVTLTPTMSSGYTLIKIGTLLEANGVDTLVSCLFDPQIIIQIP